MNENACSVGAPEHLGAVSCPSGILLILDGGDASIWSHDRAPLLPDTPEIVGGRADVRDFVITGPDAREAGRALGRSHNPFFVYDHTAQTVAALHTAFNSVIAEHALCASLDVLADRVPHRQRVDLLIERVGTAGIVEFHGFDRRRPVRAPA